MYDKKCQNRVFPSLKNKVETAKKSIIGIIPQIEEDNSTTRDGFGSGVIFSKNEDTYYAITAAHVVEKKDHKYKIFTINTKFSGKTISINDDISYEIPDEDYYESLLDGKVEYISSTADIAIISFASSEDLPIMEFESKSIKIGDKIIAIGHPEGDKFVATYGYIKTDKQTHTFGSKATNETKKDIVIGHNAYLKQGNSGGVAISENMKIMGINIGGDLNLLGYFQRGYMIPYDLVQKEINIWESQSISKEWVL